MGAGDRGGYPGRAQNYDKSIGNASSASDRADRRSVPAHAGAIAGVRGGRGRQHAAGDRQHGAGAGTILLYDGANLVQSEPYQSFYNGTFAVRLNEAAASALSAGVLRSAAVQTWINGLCNMTDIGKFRRFGAGPNRGSPFVDQRSRPQGAVSLQPRPDVGKIFARFVLNLTLKGFRRTWRWLNWWGQSWLIISDSCPKNPAVYSFDPTNAYDWSIDLRTGLMWMRSQSCDGGNCRFAMYDQQGGVGSGVELVQSYLSKVNATLNTSYPGELFALMAPSRAQWVIVLPFGTAVDWTSDVQSEAPASRFFPAWNNWVVDISVGPNFTPGGPTASLQPVSPAPLADPYHFLYRSHQDDFSMNVFTAGPSMSTARADATVTPLVNGKVLIAGGVG